MATGSARISLGLSTTTGCPTLIQITVQHNLLVVWLSNIVGYTNEVNQRQARLVVGWVMVNRRVNHFGM